ncbi:MAG: Crp/Fnr family transcriptional regulator [Gallicola sp.]|nr:Crp/Fnr family transcriptional regulator [Gallicola sp.]
MNLEEFFPVWKELSEKEKNKLKSSIATRRIPKGKTLQNDLSDCKGLFLIQKGQLRAYIYSPAGKEISLYRLFDHDICLFSASCMMEGITFHVTIEAEKDTDILVLSPMDYKEIMEESAPLANYTNKIMASRFSEVMWVMEQVLWKSMDQRVASFLLEEMKLENSKTLKITHERIAYHLGTAREVITRMLRYFQKEELVKLSRATIELIEIEKLKEIQKS